MPSINYYRIQAVFYKNICLFSVSADFTKKQLTLELTWGETADTQRQGNERRF
jgi:hypothetical protein